MGIIVGSKTWMECDVIGCKSSSTPMFDQNEAVNAAYRDGWHKDQNNGKTTCPACMHQPFTNPSATTAKEDAAKYLLSEDYLVLLKAAIYARIATSRSPNLQKHYHAISLLEAL